MAPPFQVLCNQSNKVKLVFVGVLLFKFIFIKSWNFNRNENGEASPWCLGLLWDTRWVSVLVVIFPAKLFFYRRVIDGSASFGDTCKDQMASVSRRVPLLLIDFLCVNSCSFHQYFLAFESFLGLMNMDEAASYWYFNSWNVFSFLVKTLVYHVVPCTVFFFGSVDAGQVLDILNVSGLWILEMVVSCPFVFAK